MDRRRRRADVRSNRRPQSNRCGTTRACLRDTRGRAESSLGALGRASALRRHCFFLGVVDLEDRVELRELEELEDSLGRVDEDQLAVLRRELAEVADELADAGGVDV